MEDLSSKSCQPCKGGVPPLSEDRSKELLQQLDQWKIIDQHHLHKELIYPDFVQALAAVNTIGNIAENEGHHPDLYLTWGKVRVEIWTHKINGLTESDFILAAKIDESLK